MFIPKYTITNSILKDVGQIEAARQIIAGIFMSDVWQAKFKKESEERMLHHSTHLDGNSLSLDEVRDLLRGVEVQATEKDIQEVLNLKGVYEYITQLVANVRDTRNFQLTHEIIVDIHKLLVHRLAADEYTGKFRTRQVVIKNSRTGEIAFTPPPTPEVPYLLEDLINWVNSDEGRETHPVLRSGLFHFEFMRIHPFVEGNGKVARSIAQLLLMVEDYDLKGLLSIDEYFDADPMRYYSILQDIANQKVMDTHERDLTLWLEYFTGGVNLEFERVKQKIQRVTAEARVKGGDGEEMLTERQIIIIEYLHKHKAMQNKDFRKIFPDYSDDTVLREMKFLKEKGLVKKLGGTKKATYVLA